MFNSINFTTMSTTLDIVNEISKHGKSESGHIMNVANFEQLLSSCTGYGANYNPSKAAIKVASMNTLLTSGRTAIANEEDKHNAWKIAVDAREILFAPAVLSKLVTKIINALRSSDVTKQKIDDALTYSRKLQGRRAKPKIKNSNLPIGEPVPGAEILIEQEQKYISTSQMGYDNRLDNFSKLVNLLSTDPGYAPNETSLKVATLNTLLADMKAKNTAVINARTTLSNASIDRNKILYKDVNGMHDIFMSSKAYIRSVFGVNSPEYKQVSKLKFIKPKNLFL